MARILAGDPQFALCRGLPGVSASGVLVLVSDDSRDHPRDGRAPLLKRKTRPLRERTGFSNPAYVNLRQFEANRDPELIVGLEGSGRHLINAVEVGGGIADRH